MISTFCLRPSLALALLVQRAEAEASSALGHSRWDCEMGNVKVALPEAELKVNFMFISYIYT